MRRLRLSWLAGALIALVCTIAVRAQTGTPDSTSFPDTDDHFKYGSIGTEEGVGLPYWIWNVLPTVFEDKLPKRPGVGYERIGFVLDETRAPAADRHVVPARPGRARRPQLRDLSRRHVSRERPRARVRSSRACRRIRWTCRATRNFLTACANDPALQLRHARWRRSARRIPTSAGSIGLIYQLFVVGATKKGILERARDNAWFDARPPFGPGRVDTFNPYKVILEIPIDDVVGTVDLPSLWNQRMRAGMWLHWDGNNDSVEERNKSAAIGAGATPDSLDLESMKRIENWILDLKPPPYPAARIDQARARRRPPCLGPGLRELPLRSRARWSDR